MIILDTDHLTVLRYSDHPRCARLNSRLQAAPHPVTTTVITWEEQLRGWLAEVKSSRTFQDQVVAYDQLLKLAHFVQEWDLVPFDDRAAQQCQSLRAERIRVGTQDMKIAAIALVHDSLLLSANLHDFRKIPGLRVENWLG